MMMREFRKGRKVTEQGRGILLGDTGRITKESGYFTHVLKDRPQGPQDIQVREWT